jgi:hypothetical protein
MARLFRLFSIVGLACAHEPEEDTLAQLWRQSEFDIEARFFNDRACGDLLFSIRSRAVYNSTQLIQMSIGGNLSSFPHAGMQLLGVREGGFVEVFLHDSKLPVLFVCGDDRHASSVGAYVVFPFSPVPGACTTVDAARYEARFGAGIAQSLQWVTVN